MIWSLILLVCNEETCVAMSGPMTKTEAECAASLEENVAFVAGRYPETTVVTYKCIPWGAPA